MCTEHFAGTAWLCGRVLTKAAAFLVRAFNAPRQDAEAIRFARAFGQARYLERLETDRAVDETYGVEAARFRARWRSRVRRDAKFLEGAMPDVTRDEVKRVEATLKELTKPASRAQFRDQLKKRVLIDWNNARIEYALDVLWQATITTAPRRPGLNIGSLPANEKQVLDTASVAWLREGLTSVRTIEKSAAEPFSIERWRKSIRSVDTREFIAAWIEGAKHNVTSKSPMGIVHAMSSVDPHSVPPTALLKRNGKIVAPHEMLRHIVQHPDARAR